MFVNRYSRGGLTPSRLTKSKLKNEREINFREFIESDKETVPQTGTRPESASKTIP